MPDNSSSHIADISTYEDFLSAYIQLEETTATFSWLKADLLDSLARQFGEKSLVTLSKDIHQPRSTIVNYVRAARAFPQDKRLPDASFTLHFQASFADHYDPKAGVFTTEDRFKWLNEAVGGGWSTRRLADQIHGQKLADRIKDEDEPIILEGVQKLQEIEMIVKELGKDVPNNIEKIRSLREVIKQYA